MSNSELSAHIETLGTQAMLALRNGQVEQANDLAALLLQYGLVRQAIETLQFALGVQPDSAATLLNLGVALKMAGDLEGAAGALERALALEPERAETFYNLGGVLQALGRAGEALGAYRQALALHPDWAQAHNRLGTLLQAQGRAAEARGSFARAASLEPGWFLPHHNLGQIAMAEGEEERAIAHFRDAIEREPGFAASHLDLGALLLRSGRFEEGWREFEWRFGEGGRTPGHPGHDVPVWDGSPLDGRTVMVWIEQGLGDNIQFVRYLPLIRKRGGRVWLQTPHPLLRLYESLDGVDRLVAPDEEVDGFDVQIPLMSLPRIFGTALDSIPAPVPYLAAPACEPPALARITGSTEALRVGIVWASCPGNPAAGRRDCDPSHFVRLARLPGIRLYSLQFGERAGDLQSSPESGIEDLSGVIGDFATTAAFVRRMDLVITVDTAMAHLAGALGQRVWTLLSEPADWRWLEERDDSPWYPTMRLFRQLRPGDWTSVFDRVEAELAQEPSSDRRRSRASQSAV
jgi:Flp pilus assembly protein TadD